jgi:hypothetical protein
MQLYTVIAFHYVEDRLQYLEQTLSWLIDINTEHTKIVIQTNDVTAAQHKKLKMLLSHQPKNVEIEIEPIRDLKDPFMLTWAHKCRMLEFKDSTYTHFAYLEDDMVLTQDLVDYWIDVRSRFKKRNLNLIPGFFRVEFKDGYAYSTDIKYPYRVNDLTRVTLDRVYVSLPQPYQGCFFMDRELVEEHISSPSFSPETCRRIPNTANDTRERANMGNMYENIPEGFAHRMLIPLDIITQCWIHHCANTYVNMPDTLHGKLHAEHIFTY